MPNYSMQDPAYWQIPERFREVSGRSTSRNSYFFMGDPDDAATPMAVVLDMEPGRIISRHGHPCERFEVVARGSITVFGGQVLYAGDVMIARPGEIYGPKVVGPDGCTTIEFFSDQTGVTDLASELDDGTRVHAKLLEGEQFPPNLGGQDWALALQAEVLELVAQRARAAREPAEA